LARQYEGKVALVSMPGKAGLGEMRAFVERHGLGFLPNAADPEGELWAKLGVRGPPAWIFIDAGGKTTMEFGDLGEEALKANLDRLLAQ
jgi:hypothetical protein